MKNIKSSLKVKFKKTIFLRNETFQLKQKSRKRVLQAW